MVLRQLMLFDNSYPDLGVSIKIANKFCCIKMEAITFSPAQLHVFNLVSHIKTEMGLERLQEQLAAFYAKQVDDEMDSLWESGQWNEQKLQELRGSHFRTPYKK